MRHLTFIEPLEARIAPATILSPYKVSYLDGNGQTAVVKISKPLFTSVAAAERILQFDVTDFSGNTQAQNLSEINLIGGTDAQDMSISVTVLAQVNAPNTVSVGSIQAAVFTSFQQVSQNIDLGNINIQGDLGFITAGDNLATPAISSLKVLSMNEGENSFVLGPITSLHDAGDFGANLDVIGLQFGTISHLYIGGALTGSPSGGVVTGTPAGVIEFTGHIGSATIGSIAGSSTAGSGSIIGSSVNNSRIGSIQVLGSVTGGSGLNTGEIFSEISIGKIVIGGNLQGGTAGDASDNGDSGFIETGHLSTLSIAGAVIGGNQGATVTTNSTDANGTVTSITGPNPNQTASFSGAVLVRAARSISIGGIQGGSGLSSGLVEASGSLGKITIRGDVTGGTAGDGRDGSGTAGYSGAIVGASADSIAIFGSVTGGNASTDTTATTVTPKGGSPSTTTLPAHTANTSGVIIVDSAPSLFIEGGIHGGSGFSSGVLSSNPAANAAFGSINIQGDVTGASGVESGSIFIGPDSTAGSVHSLRIGGSLIGGSAASSGEVAAASSLGSLLIGGNITGGTADFTGAVYAGGSLGKASIGGNLAGGSAIHSSTPVLQSGYIEAGSIGALNIAGGVFAYANSGSGGIASSGAIRSDQNIVSLQIGGPVTGVEANPVIISAAQGPGTAKHPRTDLAIGSVAIGANATYLDILAGYASSTATTANSVTNPIGAPLGTPVDGTAQIGAVALGGTLAGSNIVAGAELGTASHFGSAGNAPISGSDNKTGLHSSIASIVVTGTAGGNGVMNDSFGFVSEELMSVKINGTALTLQPGPENDTTPVPIAGNLYALEVGPT